MHGLVIRNGRAVLGLYLVALAVAIDATAGTRRIVASDLGFLVEFNRIVIVVEVHAAAVLRAVVVGNLGAIRKLDSATLIAHIDAATQALGVVVNDLGVAHFESRILAMKSHASAMTVAAEPLVGEVAGNGDIIQVDLDVLVLGADAASAVVVITGAARNQAAVNAGRAAAVILPEVVAAIPNARVERAIMHRLGRFSRTAIHRERRALFHMDDVTFTLAIPFVAEAESLVAVDHVAIELEGVVAAFGNHDAPVGLGVPIVGEADSHILAGRFRSAEQR